MRAWCGVALVVCVVCGRGCVWCVEQGMRRGSVCWWWWCGRKGERKGREEVGREGRRRDTDGRTATRTHLMPSELRLGWSENLQ